MSELSAQLAMTSFSWFGENGDPYEDAVGDTGHNMKNMLTSMGFTDVQTNRYCQTDTLTDSVGVAIGRRIISVGNNDYTLLAIPIRSSGYKREWVGNLTVGNGNFVKGI